MIQVIIFDDGNVLTKEVSKIELIKRICPPDLRKEAQAYFDAA